MEESSKPSAPSQDVVTATLRRLPNEASPTPSDAFAVTIGSDPKTPSQGGGVAPVVRGWNLPLVDRERYRLDGVVAEGGHGRILRAQDLHLERLVALKEPISFGSSTEERFLREARITARLQHPSIVPVYEAGRWPGGEPFYAMKLLSGRSLARLIDSLSSLSERLAALPHVLAVAEAMAYAHSQRVIHRDLKPSNILVGEFGETVVIDWGLAKELDKPELPPSATGSSPVGSPDPERTQMGTILGTPAYMPPEQASGQTVDERADVYALGSILYHLLSGQAPYLGTTSQEVLQRVITEEPTPLAQLQPRLTQDLLDIVSRAMARDPAQRYPSARELAEDLRRFLQGQLVGAHRYTRWERMQRFARRHRTTLIVAAFATLALVVGEVIDHNRIVQERDRAEQKQAAAEKAEREASQRADTLTIMEARTQVAQDPARVFTLLDSLSPGFTDWGKVRTLAAAALAHGIPTSFHDHTGALNNVRFSPDGRSLVTASDDHTLRLWDVTSGTHRILETYEDEVWRTAFSPDGRYVASCGKDGQVRLFDLATGTSRLLQGHTASVGNAYFSPDGRLLYTAGYDGRIWLWDVASRTGRLLGLHGSEAMDVQLLADGRHLISVGGQATLAWLWNLEDGSKQPLVPRSYDPNLVAMASQSGAIAIATLKGQILLWESLDKPMRVLEGKHGLIHSLEFSPDGRYLAAHSRQGPVELWELPSGTSYSLESPPGWWVSLAFSPDSRWLAAGGWDGKTRLWEVATRRLRVLHGATTVIASVAFSPDGKWLATGSHDQVARLHEVEDRSTRILTTHEGKLPEQGPSRRSLGPSEYEGVALGKVYALVPSSDGKHVLSAGAWDGQLHLSPLESGSSEAVQAHPGRLVAAFALPDGSKLVTAGEDGTVSLWDGQARQLQQFKGPSQRTAVLAISADGARVAAGEASGMIWIWDAASGQGRVLGQHATPLYVLAFTPDGRHLISGGQDGELRFWELSSGQSRVVYRHREAITALAFSPDGHTLASGSKDHSAWLQRLDPSSGLPVEGSPGRRLDQGGLGVLQLRFSLDGRQLFVASLGDFVVRRWEVETGTPLKGLTGHPNHVLQMNLSPDGQRLATASVDGSIRVWDLQSGESRTLRVDDVAVLQVAFSRDGRYVVSAGHDGTVRLWRDDLPLEPSALRAWLHQMTSH
jgi:WD40 repeat protein